MRSLIVIGLVFVMVLFAVAGCKKTGERNNPYDPGASNYESPTPTN